MTSATYQRTSPYYHTPQSSNYLGVWVPPAVGRSPTDSLITLGGRYIHRPDLLSYDLYGTPRLWWIFSMVNPDSIRDPIYDMVDGLTIYVPSNTSVQGLL
jgi:hypothetical protein